MYGILTPVFWWFFAAGIVLFGICELVRVFIEPKWIEAAQRKKPKRPVPRKFSPYKDLTDEELDLFEKEILGDIELPPEFPDTPEPVIRKKPKIYPPKRTL